jgi:transposase
MDCVGIDVGKRYLDVALPGERLWRVTNDAVGLSDLLARLAALPSLLVVLEPTGGYERPALVCLGAAGIPVALVNPRKVRQFAQSVGQLAKTDALDARILARYGTVVRPAPTPYLGPDAYSLASLVARRRQLLVLRVADEQRAALADPAVAESIQRHLAWLRDEVATLDRAIALAVQASPVWSERASLLRSVPGVGPALAAALVVELAELGSVTRGKVAALVGLAPYAVDSGGSRGYRRIVGGRADLRSMLYMPTLAAIRCNPPVRAFYRRLRDAGKPHKVAMVACMRKLLTILNAIARSGEPWAERIATSSTIVPISPQ